MSALNPSVKETKNATEAKPKKRRSPRKKAIAAEPQPAEAVEHLIDRRQTEAKINVRAWKDPDFKEKLINDPHTALEELGMSKVPKSLEVVVAEEGKNQWVIRLHNRPVNYAELTDEDLEKAAAGEAREAKCCPKSPTS